MEMVTEKVRRGALLLDEKNPGWAEQINLDLLDIGSMEACVLGQLYGHYSDGMNQLELAFGSNHGFNVPFAVDWANALWTKEIESRLDH